MKTIITIESDTNDGLEELAFMAHGQIEEGHLNAEGSGPTGHYTIVTDQAEQTDDDWAEDQDKPHDPLVDAENNYVLEETTDTTWSVEMSSDEYGGELFGPYADKAAATAALLRLLATSQTLNDGVLRSFRVGLTSELEA